MGRGERRTRVEPEELTARITGCTQSYYISRSNAGDRSFIDDEAIIEVEAVVEAISKRHRRHVGEPMFLSLLHSNRYVGDGGSATPFFGSVTVRGSRRSALAYLPAEPFWSLPHLMERDARVIELRFSPLRRGYGELLSLFVGNDRIASM